MQTDQTQRIRDALATLVATYASVTKQMERMIAELTRVLESGATDRQPNRLPRSPQYPIANRETLSAVWKNRTCFLGNTVLFRFFERLARVPNQYVTHTDLMDDVWGEHVAAPTLRGVAKRLRDQLRRRGLQELAEAIDGSVFGHYGLIVD